MSLSLFAAIASTVAAGPAPGDTFVHLFEWPHHAVALECETHLKQSGINAVQISPVNEVIDHPTWWSRYQPVTFTKFVSRSGNRAQLENMLERCRKAGVDIYADVVINHTADYGASGTGTAGTPWRLKQHPGLSPANYHAQCTITDYSDTHQVQNCQLGALPDLDTGSRYVQGMLNNYLKSLANMGVIGFRIDAAKHISPDNLEAILEGVHEWRFLEVIGNASAPAQLQPPAYAHLGAVTNFSPAYQLKQVLESGNWQHYQPEPANYQAISFVDNHDTERHGAKSYQHGADDSLYRQAQIALLLADQGYVKLLAGYAYTDKDAAAPDSNVCTDSWRCWHRDTAIKAAIALRKQVVNQPVDHWHTFNNHQGLSFTRGELLVVINSGEATQLSVPKLWQNQSVTDQLTNTSLRLGNQLSLAANETRLLTR